MREQKRFSLPTKLSAEVVVTNIAFAEGPTFADDGSSNNDADTSCYGCMDAKANTDDGDEANEDAWC